MMAEAGERVAARTILHFARTVFLILVDKLEDGFRPTLGFQLCGRIGLSVKMGVRGLGKNRLRLRTRLVWRERAMAAYHHKPARCGAASAIRAVANNVRFQAAFLDP